MLIPLCGTGLVCATIGLQRCLLNCMYIRSHWPNTVSMKSTPSSLRNQTHLSSFTEHLNIEFYRWKSWFGWRVFTSTITVISEQERTRTVCPPDMFTSLGCHGTEGGQADGEMQLDVTVKREHLKPQTKEVTVVRAQVRKEVVIMSTRSLSCSRRSREVAGHAATQWPQLCVRGPRLYRPQCSGSRSIKEQSATIYWMIVVPVACVGSMFL